MQIWLGSCIGTCSTSKLAPRGARIDPSSVGGADGGSSCVWVEVLELTKPTPFLVLLVQLFILIGVSLGTQGFFDFITRDR
jgi:hypothetical protein